MFMTLFLSYSAASPLSCPRKRASSHHDTNGVYWVPACAGTTTEKLCDSSHPLRVVVRLLAGAVAAQRAFLADRIGALEDPVLPGGQPRKDFRFHGLGPPKAQVGLEPGQSVRREARTFLEEHAHLVVPVDIVERKRDKAEH